MSPTILNTREMPRLKIYNHQCICPLPKAPFRNFSLIKVKKSDTSVSKSLLPREKYFVDSPTIGVQLVEKRNILKKYDDCTWVMSVERLLALLA